MNTLNIRDKVLEQIKSGKVRMRPHAYFVARVVAVIVIAAMAFLASVFFVSFVLFSLNASGGTSLLGFGVRGVSIFFGLFPWLTAGAIFVLLVLLDLLIRTFRLGYRIPILRVFFGIIVLTSVVGLALAFTPLHDVLQEKADNGDLFLFGDMYGSVHVTHKEEGVFRGAVASVGTSTLVISHDDMDRDTDDGVWTVVPPASFNLGTVRPKDKVYVAGDVKDDVIHAYGIKKLPASKKQSQVLKKTR